MNVKIPLPGRPVEQHMGLASLLAQTEVWYNLFGNEIRTADMDTRYVENLRAYLLRNAKRMAHSLWLDTTLSPTGPRGDMAVNACERIIDDLETAIWNNPESWMKNQPLWQQLDRMLKRYALSYPSKLRLGKWHKVSETDLNRTQCNCIIHTDWRRAALPDLAISTQLCKRCG